jgi:hypothetical protein
MTTISKRITAAVLAATVAAGSLLPLATSAQAADYRSHDGGYSHRDRGDWEGPRYGHRKHHRPRHHDRHHDHHDRRAARGAAIGLGALAIGAIIAGSQHNRHHGGYHD